MLVIRFVGAGIIFLAVSVNAYEGAPPEVVQAVIRESTVPDLLPVNVWNPSPSCDLTRDQVSAVVDQVLILSRVERLDSSGALLYLNPMMFCSKRKAGGYIYHIKAAFKKFDSETNVFWELEGSWWYVGIAHSTDDLLDVVEVAVREAIVAYIYSHKIVITDKGTYRLS